MKRDALILHPLPRTVEIDKAVDADPRALYFRQANNGLYRADGAADDAVGRVERISIDTDPSRDGHWLTGCC